MLFTHQVSSGCLREEQASTPSLVSALRDDRLLVRAALSRNTLVNMIEACHVGTWHDLGH